MNGQINSSIRQALRQDEFEQIVGYILSVCCLVLDDFQRRKRTLPNDENRIRSIILNEYLDDDEVRKNYGMSDCEFIPEVPENYDGAGHYKGRTDIRIKVKSDFDRRAAYYIAECKRIDGSPDLNKAYVHEGIARYSNRKYSAYFGKNIMLGFVVKPLNIAENTKRIEQIQNELEDTCMHGKFRLLDTQACGEVYNCIYQMEKEKLELRHIFSDFSDIME